MKVTPMRLPGLIRFEPRVFSDERGSFFEGWNAARYRDAGIHDDFVQDNIASSVYGVLRGLHLQRPHGQGKLVSVLSGSVFDVAADVRHGSPTFGQWIGVELSDRNRVQLYLPPGFAHGYQVTSPSAVFCYKVTDYYDPGAELVITPHDPAIGIRWPIAPPILSPRDMNGLLLTDIRSDRLPVFG
ncbi:MAG: dTDP-4-dehydrorhamnose 3,5-epimerase [Gemmatimonadota bacterium]